MARPSYQARQHDTTQEKAMLTVISREVCSDIRSATRDCCMAYRAVKVLKESTGPRRERVTQNLRNFRRKLLVAALLHKMLQDTRAAEQMWKQCGAGLGSWGFGSWNLSTTAKSLAVRSFALGSLRPGAYACGSISSVLRRRRNNDENEQPDEQDAQTNVSVHGQVTQLP